MGTEHESGGSIHGKSVVNKAASFLDLIAEGIAEVKYAQNFKEQVTFKECVAFCKESKGQYPEVEGFILSVQKNFDPRNENDALIIVQSLLNGQGRPVSADGETAVSRVLHTRTIDADLAKFLDGADKKICMINKICR